jgi:hypothetical protein
MKTHQALFVLFFGIMFQSSYGQFTDEINSNRPGKSMMAFAVGKTIFQTLLGIERNSNVNQVSLFDEVT